MQNPYSSFSANTQTVFKEDGIMKGVGQSFKELSAREEDSSQFIRDQERQNVIRSICYGLKQDGFAGYNTGMQQVKRQNESRLSCRLIWFC